jgi:hypothetical protein
VVSTALVSDDFTLDLAPQALRPSLPSVLLGSDSTAGTDAGMRVVVTDLSAHPHSQVIGFARPEVAPSQAGGPVLTAQSMNELLETQPTGAGAATALQVRAVAITGGSLRVRFNQPIDLARLATVVDASGAMRSGQVVVMRGDREIPGLLLPDPDGMGLRFVPDGGPLPAGEYSLRLGSAANGFANGRGELLDGDFDGAAGGDYRARFSVEGVALLKAAAEVPAAEPQSSAHEAAVPASALTTLLGGVGGVSMLMAGLAPALPMRRQRGLPAAQDIRVRSQGGAAAPAAPVQRSAAWLADWLDSRSERSNDWRIRL